MKQFSKYQYIIACRIAFSNTWCKNFYTLQVQFFVQIKNMLKPFSISLICVNISFQGPYYIETSPLIFRAN